MPTGFNIRTTSTALIKKPEENGGVGPGMRAGARGGPLPPIGNRENAEAGKSERVPVRRGGFINGEEEINDKDRESEPEKVEDDLKLRCARRQPRDVAQTRPRNSNGE